MSHLPCEVGQWTRGWAKHRRSQSFGQKTTERSQLKTSSTSFFLSFYLKCHFQNDVLWLIGFENITFLTDMRSIVGWLLRKHKTCWDGIYTVGTGVDRQFCCYHPLSGDIWICSLDYSKSNSKATLSRYLIVSFVVTTGQVEVKQVKQRERR